MEIMLTMIPQCGWFIICSRSNRIRWDIHTKWTDSNSHKIFEFLSWLSKSSWIKSQALTLNYPATLCHLIASIKSSRRSRDIHYYITSSILTHFTGFGGTINIILCFNVAILYWFCRILTFVIRLRLQLYLDT